MHAELVSADAIALYAARVATLVRDRMGYAAILDDADRMLDLARRTGACDHFVWVKVRNHAVRRKYAEAGGAGEGLCDVLQRWARPAMVASSAP